jgi:hypothetical protein
MVSLFETLKPCKLPQICPSSMIFNKNSPVTPYVNPRKRDPPFRIIKHPERKRAFVSSSFLLIVASRKIALQYMYNSPWVSRLLSYNFSHLTSLQGQGRHSPKPSSTSASALLLQHPDPRAERGDPTSPRLVAAPTRVFCWRLRVVRVEAGDARLLLSVAEALLTRGRPFADCWGWMLQERK